MFRSRIAEAYTNAKQLPNISCSSSGVAAGENNVGDVCWEFELLAEVYGLVPYMSKTWQRTKSEMLDQSDVIICMDDSIYVQVASLYPSIKDKQHEVWNIVDLPDLDSDDESKILYHIQRSKEDYVEIRSKVDDLLSRL